MILAGSPAECSSTGFLIFDAHYRAVWVNETLAAFFGLYREELTGKDRQGLLTLLKGVLDNPERFAWEVFAGEGKTGHGDCRVLAAHGRRERWLSCCSIPIDSGPFIGGRLVQCTDVTEGHRLRRQWKSKETQERGSLPTGESVSESTEVYVAASLGAGASYQSPYSTFRRKVGGDSGRGGNSLHLLPSAVVAHASSVEFPMEDFTHRNRVEDQVRSSFIEAGRSRDWIASILRSVADGLIVADGRGQVLLMNAASENLLGVRQPQLFQASLEDCIQDRRLLKRLQAAVDAGEDGVRLDYELPDGPQGTRVLMVDISQVRNEEGESEGTVFLLRDITRERELDRMKNEFISTAAHELRTPLTSIMGFSELLLTRKDIPQEQQEDFLTFIHQKAENLSRIISDLLDVSRIEAGRGLELYRDSCEINRLLQETIDPYRKCSEKHELEVLLHPEETVLQVDRGKIIQVLENLLGNAFKYSPKGGRIRVTASRARGAYLISVEDQGIGMSRDQVARAFDKFYRGDSSNAAVEGTGLGLAITKYIVEAHGGRIWLESRRGRGTTAFFTLPLPPDQIL